MFKKTIIVVGIMALAGVIFIATLPLLYPGHSAAAACVNRLRLIDSIKHQWALEQSKTADDVPTWNDLYRYLPSSFTNTWWTNGQPVCPGGGTYTIGRVGAKPTCSIGGPQHSEP